MSPTIFRERGFRFLFFSREEPQRHIHVQGSKGEAKFWIDPEISLAENHGISKKDLRIVQSIIEERENEIRSAWAAHFGG